MRLALRASPGLLRADDEEEDDQGQDVDEPGEQEAAYVGAVDDNADVGYLTEERLDGGRGADDEGPDLFDADFNPISALQQMSHQRDGGDEQPFHVLAARRRRSMHDTEVLWKAVISNQYSPNTDATASHEATCSCFVRMQTIRVAHLRMCCWHEVAAPLAAPACALSCGCYAGRRGRAPARRAVQMSRKTTSRLSSNLASCGRRSEDGELQSTPVNQSHRQPFTSSLGTSVLWTHEQTRRCRTCALQAAMPWGVSR